jgi:hypothetical protein
MVDRVEEIEAATASWERTLWDEQLDSDYSSGKLDLLFDEAESESAQGLLREWPPAK